LRALAHPNPVRKNLATSNPNSLKRRSLAGSVGVFPTMEPNAYVAKHGAKPHSRVCRRDVWVRRVCWAPARRGGLFASF
jgi:hypothetical protein